MARCDASDSFDRKLGGPRGELSFCTGGGGINLAAVRSSNLVRFPRETEENYRARRGGCVISRVPSFLRR